MNQMKINEDLRPAVIAALAFFDIFRYPLTLSELKRGLFYLPTGEATATDAVTPDLSLNELREWLATNQELKKLVCEENGFYFLQGRREIVARRLDRYRLNQRKWRRARVAAKLLRAVPFIRLVAVCNTLALSNTRAGGDIDFFIITKAGRIWLTRLLVTTILSWAGLRRHGQRVANRICLSFYLTDDSLDLSPIAAKPYDIYLAYWIRQLVPLLDFAGTYQKLQAANSWIKSFLPYAYGYAAGPRRFTESGWLGRLVKRSGEGLLAGSLGRALENLARRLQKSKMSHNTRSVAQEHNIKVVISDQMLKFHEFKNDPKEVFRSRFEQRLREVYGQHGLPGVAAKPRREPIAVN